MTANDDVSRTRSEDEVKRKPVWDDYAKAVSRDLGNFPQRPCVRSTFLIGIASGAAIGATRFVTSKHVMRSCNWAVGGFLAFSLVSWHRCQIARENERKKVQLIIAENARVVEHRRTAHGDSQREAQTKD